MGQARESATCVEAIGLRRSGLMCELGSHMCTPRWERGRRDHSLFVSSFFFKFKTRKKNREALGTLFDHDFFGGFTCVTILKLDRPDASEDASDDRRFGRRFGKCGVHAP